jgi:hypothetical protein
LATIGQENLSSGLVLHMLGSKLLRGSPIGGIHRFVETGKDYLFDGIVFAHFRGRFAYRDLDSEVDWKSVDAATDGGKGAS